MPGTFAQPAQPARHGVVDVRTEDVSREGQIALHSEQFLTLPPFAFLLGVCEQEGALPTTLQSITIEELDKDQHPDTATLAKYRAELMRSCGVREQALLSEITGRSPPQSGAQPGASPRGGHRPPPGQQEGVGAASAPATITRRSPRR